MEELDYLTNENSDLRRQQLRMLNILEYIDSICKKHNISYWLSSGTLLGAVRHEGFIPWDDDLDIEMLKADYDKLISILKQDSLPSDFVLHNHSTDKNYFLPFSKIRDKNTIIEEVNNRSKRVDLNLKYRGIFVDIFFLENISFPLMKISRYMHYILYRISFLRNDKYGVKLFIGNGIWNIYQYGFYPSFRFISKLFSDKKVLRHTYGLPFEKPRYLKDLFPLQSIKFENGVYPCPKNLDNYLSELYGNNYMELPPMDKRKPHAVKIIFR